MEPQKPSRGSLLPNLPGAGSLAIKAAYIAGGLLVLVVIFIIIKGLLGGSNLTTFVSAVQDQQEMLHLISNTTQQPNLTVTTQNFAATAQLSLSSVQAADIQYLANNGSKVSVKTLNLKVNLTTDTQLTNAVAAGNYDQTFQSIMNSKLATYINDLKVAYKQAPGPGGRALLNNDYKQANLLITQLNSTAQ